MPSLAVPLLAALFATGEPPGCTLAHPEAWREYRSANFVLTTDVGQGGALGLLKRLELTRALVLQAVFGRPVELAGLQRVVAYGDPVAFEAVAGKNVGGFFLGTPAGETLVVLPVEGSGAAPVTVAHELAHRISWSYFPRQPNWFAEGLARFVETVAVPVEAEGPPLGSHIARGVRGQGGRYAGLAPQTMVQELAQAGDVGARELLAWNGDLDGAVPGRFHAASWRLYHFLWNRRPAAFTDFQARLSRAEPPGVAWRAAFPEWDPATAGALEALDGALRGYGTDGRYVAYRVEAPEPEVQVKVRPLSRAELHLLLLDARRFPAPGPARAALVEAVAAEVLREDPGNPTAIWLRRQEEPGTLVERLRAAVVARPDDWRGATFLARRLKAPADAAEKEALLRRAVDLAPDQPAPHADLAWHLVSTGRAGEARRFADRAVDLAPWAPTYVDTLAVVASELGQCGQATQLVQRTADLVGDAGRDADGTRQRLVEIGLRCMTRDPAAGR